MKAIPGITNRNYPYKPALRAYLVSLRSTLELPEPILYEKEGWGIYGTHRESSVPGGAIETKHDGHTLTHLGCDCDYPNWALSRFIWDRNTDKIERKNIGQFICQECGVVLSEEAYQEFCKVYNLINNLQMI